MQLQLVGTNVSELKKRNGLVVGSGGLRSVIHNVYIGRNWMGRTNCPRRIHAADWGLGQRRWQRRSSGEMTEAQFIDFLALVMKLIAANRVDGSVHQICMDLRHPWEMVAAGKLLIAS